MLRSYSTLGRAIGVGRRLQARHPEVAFHVQLSPLAAYAFRWLIVATSDGRHSFVGR